MDQGIVGGRGAYRYFSEDKGRIFREEERAKEAVYIQKMERERLEKLKKKMEKEKAEVDKAAEQKRRYSLGKATGAHIVDVLGQFIDTDCLENSI